MIPRPLFAGGLLVACLALGPTPARAGWIPVGPPGGDARSITFDPEHPQVVYAGTADGVLYRSDDSGGRWQRLSPGFPLRGESLDDLAVDARGRILVAYWEVSGTGGGVARSDDGGHTFRLLPGIEGQSVRALAVDARNPDVIVVGTLSGVFGSNDGGDSWSRLSPADHPDIRNVESIAIDPRDAKVIYAGTWHLPWKTSDGGKTWHKAQAGMIDDSDVFTLNLDQRSADVVYGTACSGIYRSPDGGAHWSKIRGIPSSSRRTRAFVQHSSRPGTFFAGTTEGVWRTDDDSKTWRLVSAKELVVNAVVVLPSGRILVGADGAGILKSDDTGDTWAGANDGFSERFVARVVFDPERERVLAAIREDRQHGGVLVARWPGGTWEPLAPGLEGREVFSVAVLGAACFAGTDDGVFRLAGDSPRWQRTTVTDASVLSPRVNDLAVIAPGTVVAASTAGLLQSDDRGDTWHRVRLGLSGVVDAVATDTEGHVYAATPLGVFVSQDRGARFEPVAAAPALVHRLFVVGDGTLLAATSQGAYRWNTLGGGRRLWRPLGRLPESDIAAFDIADGGRTILASDFKEGGLFRSDDAGETWRSLATDGLRSTRLWTIAVDPRAPERLLAASSSGGLHLWDTPATSAAAGSPAVAAR
jgi:photosystem II stability/assembly factor-like uncharacterized protein